MNRRSFGRPFSGDDWRLGETNAVPQHDILHPKPVEQDRLSGALPCVLAFAANLIFTPIRLGMRNGSEAGAP